MVNPTTLIIIVAIGMGAIIGYALYRSQKDREARERDLKADMEETARQVRILSQDVPLIWHDFQGFRLELTVTSVDVVSKTVGGDLTIYLPPKAMLQSRFWAATYAQIDYSLEDDSDDDDRSVRFDWGTEDANVPLFNAFWDVRINTVFFPGNELVIEGEE